MVVRATGSLKAFSSKRSVQVAQIHAAEDPHEPYFHILEIVTATMLVEKGGVSDVSSRDSFTCE